MYTDVMSGILASISPKKLSLRVNTIRLSVRRSINVFGVRANTVEERTPIVRNLQNIHDECTYSPLSFYLFIYSENFRDFGFWIFSKSGCGASSGL